MSDEIRTYDEVAKWLPTDVREHIETSLPCRRPGGVHDWRHRPTVVAYRMGRPDRVYVSEHWRCGGCGIVTTTDPGADA